MLLTDKEVIVEKIKKIKFLLLDVDGVMTDGMIYIDSEGRETKAFSIYDGMGISRLQQQNIKVGIISGRESNVVSIRANELGIKEVYQNISDKLKTYISVRDKYGLKDEDVSFMGDDLIDISVLKVVGLAVTVPNAMDEVKKFCHIITSKPGGYGAVRELANFILEPNSIG